MESHESNIDSSNLPQPIIYSTNQSKPLHDSNHNKRRKIGDDHHRRNLVSWKSESEQQIYSTKLAHAIRHVLRQNPSPAEKPARVRWVRETSYRILAAAAKGRTRWSRAILAAPGLRRCKLRRPHKKKATGLKRRVIGGERRRLPDVQRKARVLSRLIPGCRKLSFTNLLEESTDYISALEMQVRAMTALTELLASGAPGGLGSESVS